MADKTVLLALKITGEDSGASTALNKTGAAASSAGAKMQKAGSIAGKVLAVGLAAAAAGAVAATKKAADFGEQQSKVNQIFGTEGAAALGKFADTAATKLGQSKLQALEAAASFGVIGKSAGLTGAPLVKFSTGFTKLASDMASFNNSTPQEALEAIQAGLRGETEPLRKFGVLLDDATLRQEALRQGLIKTTSQALTPQQKVLAAQALIYKQTKDQQGDFARTSDSLANKQRILSAQFENLQITIGQKLIPVGLTLVNVLLKIVDWIGRNQTTTAILVGVFGTLLAVVKITSVVMARWSAIVKIATGVQAAFNFVMAANPVLLVVAAIAALALGLVIAYKKSETFRKIVDAAFKAIKTVVVGTVQAVVGFVRKHWKTGLLLLLTGPFGLAYLAIKKYGGRIRDFVGNIISGILGFVRRHWKTGLLLLLTGPFGLAYLAIKRHGDRIRDFVRNIVDAVVGFFRGRWRDIVSFAGNAISSARDRVASGAEALRNAVVNRIERVIGFFANLPGRITRAVGNLGHLLWDAGASIISGLIDGIQSKVDDLTSKLDFVTDIIPDWKGPPERDRKLLYGSGQLIMDGLTHGIDSRSSRVRERLGRLTKDIRKSVSGATAEPIKLVAPRLGAGGGGAAVAGGRQGPLVVINIEGAVDVMATAKQIREILNRESLWRGKVIVQ